MRSKNVRIFFLFFSVLLLFVVVLFVESPYDGREKESCFKGRFFFFLEEL